MGTPQRTKSKSLARDIVIYSPEDADLKAYTVWAGTYLGVRKPGWDKTIYAHHIVAERKGLTVPEGYVISFRNKIRWDILRSNIYVVDFNEAKQNNDAKGYYYDKKKKLWQAYANRNGNSIFLGYYRSENRARSARAKFLANEARMLEIERNNNG